MRKKTVTAKTVGAVATTKPHASVSKEHRGLFVKVAIAKMGARVRQKAASVDQTRSGNSVKSSCATACMEVFVVGSHQSANAHRERRVTSVRDSRSASVSMEGLVELMARHLVIVLQELLEICVRRLNCVVPRHVRMIVPVSQPVMEVRIAIVG